MLAKMESAKARVRIQEQLDGLSVDAEVKALDNVRDAHQEHHRAGQPGQGAGRDRRWTRGWRRCARSRAR